MIEANMNRVKNILTHMCTMTQYCTSTYIPHTQFAHSQSYQKHNQVHARTHTHAERGRERNTHVAKHTHMQIYVYDMDERRGT